MTSLADLQTELFPTARPLSGAAGDGSPTIQPVAWVRVMKARVPAFDALEPGDLAVVPASALAVIAATAADLAPLVTAFAATPVSGVVLVEGDSLAPAPDVRLEELQRLAEAAGIGGFRLGPGDPAAIERAIIGFIVGRTAELERQAGLLEVELERRALAGEGPAGVVAAAAELLNRALALEGPRGEVVAMHAPTKAVDGAPGSAAYVAGRRDAAILRVPLPSGGAIAVLGTRPATEMERLGLARASTLVALELAREEAVRRAGDSGGREALPSAGPPWVVVLARQRGLVADDDTAEARSLRDQTRRALRLLAPARRLALRGDVDSLEFRLVLSAGEDGHEVQELATRVAELVGRTVAVSRPFAAPVDRPTAEADARATLEAASALPEPPRVASADRLPAYRLMGAMHNLADGPRLAAAMLAPLLSGRPDVRRERLETLKAVLDRGGVNEAAITLGVHRNTVAYRLRRIEAVTGWRLTDPDLRLPLAIALRIVQQD